MLGPTRRVAWQPQTMCGHSLLQFVEAPADVLTGFLCRAFDECDDRLETINNTPELLIVAREPQLNPIESLVHSVKTPFPIGVNLTFDVFGSKPAQPKAALLQSW